MNLSAISCSTAPSGFSRITEESTVRVPVNLGQNAAEAAEAVITVIVPLTATTTVETIAISIFVFMRIVDLSLLGDVQMHSQITAESVQ
jgi:hypothetical protein